MRYEFTPISTCEMCGSRHFRVLGMRLNKSQGRNPRDAIGIAVGVRKCEACHLIFSDPRPRPHDLADHYGVPPESYWTRPEQWSVTDEYFSGEIAEAKRLLGHLPRIRALDIGAGLGKAMRAMARAGFDTYGIEPSTTFRERCLAQTGIAADRLQLAGVEDASFPEASFDFVSFGAVLEHIQEPGRAVEKAMGWLRPGGVLHAEVPSSNYLVSKIINAYFRLRGVNYVTNLSPMHSPYHLYEFGLESFRSHGKRAGYEVAAHRFYVCEIPHLPKLLHQPLRKWMAKNDSGMQLSVWLRRSSPQPALTT
jgi:SAM-dependent methyltransferase